MILRRLGIGSQILVAFACVAFVSAVATSLLLRASFGIAFENYPAIETDAEAVIVSVLALSALITIFIAVGAGILLRSGIREAVDRMRRATEAVAAGRYSHRIGETRKDELGALSNAIDCMAERLESANGSRARMLATVSHELRTPLTVIGGQAFTLLRNERSADRRQRLEQINREVERLALLVNDLIDAAAIETRRAGLHKSMVSVSDVLDEVVVRFGHQAEESGIRLYVFKSIKDDPDKAVFNIDVDRIHQVLGNLISNAISRAHDGPDPKEIRIDWDSCNGRANIRIRNTGEPISSTEITSCFMPFSQGSSPTGRTGLGLSIAKSIVEAHGGSIAAGKDNGLTCFTISLPLGCTTNQIESEGKQSLRLLRLAEVEGVA